MKTVATSTSCLLVIKPNAACCRGARLSGCVFYCTTETCTPAASPLCVSRTTSRVQRREGCFFFSLCYICRLTSVTSCSLHSSWLRQFQAELHRVGMQRRFTPGFPAFHFTLTDVAHVPCVWHTLEERTKVFTQANLYNIKSTGKNINLMCIIKPVLQ